jgi:transposase
MKLRLEYWEKVKDIEPQNLVFLDETGVLLGLRRTHARSERGTRAYGVKPFYRGEKVTVIGAITLQEVVALMTIDNSMDSQAFEVFIEKCLVPRLWSGAVVVMDNLPAHKLASIKPMIQAVGASILCLSPYSPDFNPIELWWSQLKSLLRQFSPTTTKMVDTIIAVALDLMNPNISKTGLLIAVTVPHNIRKCCILRAVFQPFVSSPDTQKKYERSPKPRTSFAKHSPDCSSRWQLNNRGY